MADRKKPDLVYETAMPPADEPIIVKPTEPPIVVPPEIAKQQIEAVQGREVTETQPQHSPPKVTE